MIKKILLIVFVLVLVSSGTVFALDKYNKQQLIADQKRVEAEKEQYKLVEERAEADIKNNDTSEKKVTENKVSAESNIIKREWVGADGLLYKVDAIKNPDGTYTGKIIGNNTADGFIEYNWKFSQLSQTGFDDLFNK